MSSSGYRKNINHHVCTKLPALDDLPRCKQGQIFDKLSNKRNQPWIHDYYWRTECMCLEWQQWGEETKENKHKEITSPTVHTKQNQEHIFMYSKQNVQHPIFLTTEKQEQCHVNWPTNYEIHCILLGPSLVLYRTTPSHSFPKERYQHNTACLAAQTD